MFKSKTLRFDNAGFLFLGILLIAFLGFIPNYFFDAEKPLQTFGFYTHFHAIMMGIWFIILIVQPFLIRAKKREIHKLIGKFTYVFFPALILSMILLVHFSLNLEQKPVPGISFYIPLKDVLVMVPCFILAMYYRKKPLYHARFIIGTSIQMIEPGLVRAIGNMTSGIENFPRYIVTLILVDILLAILIYKDRNQKSGRWIFFLIAGMVLSIQIGVFAGIHKLDFFVNFMNWFIGLNLT